MLTSSRSVSPEIRSVPPVIRPDSSQLVSSKNASHQIPVQIFEGHGKWVRCVYFYPDEKKLVTGSHEETLRVWNRMTKVEEVLSGHTGSVQDLDVSRDGKMIVSGSKDKTVRIWNGESGETMHIFKGHEHEVNSVQFSPDASRVVSGSSDSTVQVWSVETGELAFEPIKSHGRASCVRYSPIGDRIASGARTIQIWNAETGSGILSIKNSWVCSLAWTADGTHIIGGCWGEVTIWNSHDGERLHTWKLKPGNQSWIALSLSPTGTHVATSCWNENTALVIDISTGEQKAALKHNKSVYGIAYSPSGRFIATVCNDGNVYLWDAPAVEDPPPKSPKPPFSSFLDRPAVPLARPSGNDRRGLDAFWDTLPNVRIRSHSYILYHEN
ncbi:WD40 repeat-like protein [Paxillus ammoniavirescens]|nr:WD40 repeat-like protein [Paxillus ammoniavirescens]